MTAGIAIALAVLACILSAAAGFGGSLVLVPAYMLLFGPKVGIALAAAILCCNNAAKLVAYRRSVPLKASLLLLGLTVLGATAGARLLLAAPEAVVQVAVFIVLIAAFSLEYRRPPAARRRVAAGFAFGAGLVSGFAGTSGPLKGLALRTLALDRTRLVGAASLISFAGDLSRSLVLIPALALGSLGWTVLVGAALLTPWTAWAGRQINQSMGERAFAGLFWLVMAGYAVRLLVR